MSRVHITLHIYIPSALHTYSLIPCIFDIMFLAGSNFRFVFGLLYLMFYFVHAAYVGSGLLAFDIKHKQWLGYIVVHVLRYISTY